MSYFIENRGPNGLFDILRRKDFCKDLQTSFQKFAELGRYIIEFHLTKNGLSHIYDILTLLFEVMCHNIFLHNIFSYFFVILSYFPHISFIYLHSSFIFLHILKIFHAFLHENFFRENVRPDVYRFLGGVGVKIFGFTPGVQIFEVGDCLEAWNMSK